MLPTSLDIRRTLKDPYPYLLLATLVTAGNARLLDPLLPMLASEFNVGLGDAGIVISSYSLGYGLFQFVAGALGDRMGPLRVVFGACLLAGLAMVATTWGASLIALTIGRAATGAVAGAIIPLGMAWIADKTDGHDRQFKLAQLMSAAILGAIAGQAIGGSIGSEAGWRAVLLIIGALYVVAGGGLGSSLFLARHDAASDAHAHRRGEGASTWQLLKRRDVRFILGCTMAEGAAIFGVLAFIPVFLHTEFGLGPAHAGFIMMAYGVGGLFYVMNVKRLYRRFERRSVALIGGLICMIGYLTLAGQLPLWLVVIAIAAAGFGSYMLHNVLQMLATMMAPEARSSAVALFVACFFLAQFVGIAIGGQIFARIGFGTLFVIAAIVIAGTGFLLMRSIPPGSDEA